MLDLATLVRVALALAGAVLTGFIPFLVPLLRRVTGWHITAAQGLLVDAAVKRAAGVAAEVIAANVGADPVPVKNAAVARGVAYVTRRLPDALAALGLTPAHVEEMVRAELARLLAPQMPREHVAGTLAAGSVPLAPAAAASAATPAAATPLLGGAAVRAVVTVLVLLLGAGALSACTSAQQAQALKVAQQACVIDGRLVPLAQPLVASTGTTGAALAGADASVVHPAVQAACAALGGTVATVTVSATPAQASAAGVAVPAK